MMSVEERFNILRHIGETSCIDQDKEELLNLLKNKSRPICLDGFEPSGRMHIAQGLMKIINVNKLVSAGCKVKIVIADLFAFLNNKYGGDSVKIKNVGNYFIQIFKAFGITEGDNVEFIWSSQEIISRADEYSTLVLDIAIKFNLPRIQSCGEIMGLNEEVDKWFAAHIFYACMQCADIFFLKADICQSGIDQQEVNLLAREYCDKTNRENKPIILSHHMLPGLSLGKGKMSTSDPSSAIFMDEDEATVNSKIKKAYCPPNVVEGIPCLEYIKHIVFPWFNEFKVERKEKNGGQKVFSSFEEVSADYVKGDLHPADLKPALSKAINKILQPVRDHFKNDKDAKGLLTKVKAYSLESKSKPVIANNEKLDHPRNDFESLSLTSNHTTSNMMSVDEKKKIIEGLWEECIEEAELTTLLANNPRPICYDGFEPSGRMHIAQGILKTINVNKLVSVGCKVKILIADLFAQLNNKMGGDLEKIKKVGDFFIEVWKASGMNLEGDNVEFLRSSEEINKRPKEYWRIVMDIAIRSNLKRIIRCCQIMGRNDTDELTAAQIFYPCMQCADIFFLKADICQLGMDQRKVNVLAREYCDQINRRKKPIILSHHMLPGLLEGKEKMSKSDPSSAIFMEDEEDVVNSKIMQAYCPPNVVEGNPCLEYIKYIVFPWFNEFKVERNEQSGGEKVFTSFEEVITDYVNGDLLPADLKAALSKALNVILQPVRDHFKNDENAMKLLNQVKEFRITK